MDDPNHRNEKLTHVRLEETDEIVGNNYATSAFSLRQTSSTFARELKAEMRK